MAALAVATVLLFVQIFVLFVRLLGELFAGFFRLFSGREDNEFDHTGSQPQSSRGGSLLFGLSLGAALTIGGAYIADTAKTGPDARMVNWDVVAKNTDSLVTMIKQGWVKLTG